MSRKDADKRPNQRSRQLSVEKEEVVSSPYNTPSSSNDLTSPKRKTLKRKPLVNSDMDNVDDLPDELNNEMSSFMQGFGKYVSKVMESKKKKVQKMSEESTRKTVKRVIEVNKAQSIERRSLLGEFNSQLTAVINQEEDWHSKLADTQDKFQRVVVQHQKQVNMLLSESTQRLRSIKDLKEAFYNGTDKLELQHVGQYSKLHSDIQKDMENLQKKLILDTQQQDMMTIRNQMKNMFA